MTQLEFEWGTPIVIFGRRKPDWLMNEVYQFRLLGHPAVDWRLHEAEDREPHWGFVESIRLPASHAIYDRENRTLIPGDVPPLPEPAFWALNRASEEIGNLVTPATALTALARYIERHEKPPVDPDVLAVRAILAAYAARWGGVEEATQILGGLNDDGPGFQAALEQFRTIKANGGVPDAPVA